MTELDKLREEYRNTYKRYIIKTTGSWTPEDEEQLNKNIWWIEFKSGLMAYVLVGMFLGGIILSIVWIYHLAGVI